MRARRIACESSDLDCVVDGTALPDVARCRSPRQRPSSSVPARRLSAFTFWGLAFVFLLAGNGGAMAQEVRGPSGAAPLDSAKSPVPDAAARQRSQTIIREIFGSDYAAAKTSVKKLRLAEKFVQKAEELENDPVGRFVLLQNACDIAVEVGGVQTAIKAIDQLARHYEIDALGMKTEALLKAGKLDRSGSRQAQIARLALTLVEDAVAADDHPKAKRLGTIAMEAARSARDGALIREIAACNKEFEDMAAAYSATEQARKTLEDAPGDQTANRIVGQYLCLAKRQWERGIPMLALGGPAPLCLAAKDDLQAQSKLGEVAPDVARKLADQWWDLAERQTGERAKMAVRGRAASWYLHALSSLSGMTKAKAGKRVEEVRAAGVSIERISRVGQAQEAVPVAKAEAAEGEAAKPRTAGTVHVVADFEAQARKPRKIYGVVSAGSIARSEKNRHFRFLYSRGNTANIRGAVPHSGYTVPVAGVPVSVESVLVFRYKSDEISDLRLSLQLTNQRLAWSLELAPSAEWREVRLPVAKKLTKGVGGVKIDGLNLTTFARIPDGKESVVMDLDDFRLETSQGLSVNETRKVHDALIMRGDLENDLAKHIRITNLATGRNTYLQGEPIVISYDIVNTSDKRLTVPENTQSSRPMHLIGTVQAWIEPVDASAKKTRLGGARRGSRYAAGGAIFPVPKGHVLPQERMHQQKVMRRDLNPGKYRYYVEIKSNEGVQLNEEEVEFAVVAPTP